MRQHAKELAKCLVTILIFFLFLCLCFPSLSYWRLVSEVQGGCIFLPFLRGLTKCAGDGGNYCQKRQEEITKEHEDFFFFISFCYSSYFVKAEPTVSVEAHSLCWFIKSQSKKNIAVRTKRFIKVL